MAPAHVPTFPTAAPLDAGTDPLTCSWKLSLLEGCWLIAALWPLPAAAAAAVVMELLGPCRCWGCWCPESGTASSCASFGAAASAVCMECPAISTGPWEEAGSAPCWRLELGNSDSCRSQSPSKYSTFFIASKNCQKMLAWCTVTAP